MLLLAAVPAPLTAHAQGVPKITVKSVYTLDRYGFAMISETVRFTNNESSAISIPALTFGFGNLSSDIVATNLTSGFTYSQVGGAYTVTGSQSLPASENATYNLGLLLNGVVSKEKNGGLQVLTLSSPSISSKVDSLLNVVRMPSETSFRSPPLHLTASLTGTNNTYSSSATGTTPLSTVTSLRTVAAGSSQGFSPLHVYLAERTISVAADGSPLVTDTVQFQNLGTVPLTSLYIDPLAPSDAKVTVLTLTEPRLVNPVTVALSGGALSLSYFASGYPNPGVPAGANFTITYQYPLEAKLFSTSGGQVAATVPDAPPVRAFADSYSITLSAMRGVSSPQSAPTVIRGATPWQGGTTKFTYALNLGWGADAGVPAASLIFVLLLVGLFISRTTTAEEAEAEKEEEKSSTELTSAMIKAFDEKTDLINGLWPEIEGKDPNDLNKDYFDELRGRLDSFRSRALQRLNEVKQRAASQKFSDVVNEMQATEREVDRAAKDKLNLYQQYYLRQMSKEVYDRLLPQYTRRLEKALNQLSDELHNVQREAKLL